MASQLLDGCTLIRVQSWQVPLQPPRGIEDLLGMAWPMSTGAVVSERIDVIALGPAEWLIVAPLDDSESLPRLLTDLFVGSRFVATNISSSLSRIRVTGRHARELLCKGCSIDVHPSALQPHTAPRTRFAGMPVVIRCMDNTTFDLIVTSSFCGYLLAWLADAQLEFSEVRS